MADLEASCRIGVDMFNHHKDETNILVVIGDKGYNTEFRRLCLGESDGKKQLPFVGIPTVAGASL